VALNARGKRRRFLLCRVHSRSRLAEIYSAGEIRAIVLFQIMPCRRRDRFAPIGFPWHAENQTFRVTLFQEIDRSTNTSKFAGDRALQDDGGIHARRQGIVCDQ